MAEAGRGGARRPLVGLIWTQFAPYHLDRIAAVAARLDGRCDVLAVEVASASALYAWDRSGTTTGARKVTLFPDARYEDVSPWRRFRAQFAALRRCDVVLMGVSFGEPDIVPLAFALRAVGVRLILMTESKFDDFARRLDRELVKSMLLLPYSAAIVGGVRQADFVRLLGFRHRPIRLGYDVVGLDRIRAQAGGTAAKDGTPWANRAFIFLGRYVPKKNIPFLLDAYKRYTELASQPPRRLVLVGSGELEASLRAQIAALAIDALVDLPGFLQADRIAATLAVGLALILPSYEEQWGLVVNEALAFNLPVIVGENVGARDLLVRNLVNGFVIERDSVEGMAYAMLALAEDEPTWRRMAAASAERAPLADVERFADAVEALAIPGR